MSIFGITALMPPEMRKRRQEYIDAHSRIDVEKNYGPNKWLFVISLLMIIGYLIIR